MNRKRGDNNKVKNELFSSMSSVDGVFLGLDQEANDSPEVQTLSKEFKMNISGYSSEIREEITYILVNLLEYPSSQDAQEHQYANRMGRFDIKSSLKDKDEPELMNDGSRAYCKDCGLAIQSQSIPLCTEFHCFPKVGIAAYLYFQNIKNLMVLLILLAIFYSAYALYINITEPSSTLSFDNFPKKLSFASTVQNLVTNTVLYDSMLYEGWMVVGGVLLWWAGLFLMKRTALQQERMVDDETITAADFSIMLQHVPVSMTKQLLQKEFDFYFDQIRDRKNVHGKKDLKSFNIRNFCKAVPFYFLDDEPIKENIKELQEKISQKRQQISELIEEVKNEGRFITNSQKRKSLYSTYVQLCSDRAKKEKELKELSKHFDWSQKLTTVAFVTFEHSESANVIEASNPQGFAAKFRYYLSCCTSAVFFSPANCTDLLASRAPQPEDIIWENIGIPDCSIILRKMVTYFVTLLLLGASFGIVYGLTMLQFTYSNAILSIAISLSITVINIVLGVAIRRLTVYERDITSTQRQTGLAIKSIVAQLMNSILVPIATNIYIQRNLYEVNGLVYDIFYLSLTNALLPPILKFIDIPFRIKQITICFYSNPHLKLELNQKELNSIYELAEFELGVAYVYFIDLFYFTCFYVFVHPCVVLFSLIGFGLMYWAQKHTLLSRSRRPTPSSAMLNQAMSQLVAFAPCMLSLGQFVWFNLIREDYHNFSDLTFVSHLVALGCAGIFFFLPFNSLFHAICSVPDDEDMTYDDARSHLTSDYDLLNPVTAEVALGEFLSGEDGKPSKPEQTVPTKKSKPIKKEIDAFQESKQSILKVNPTKDKDKEQGQNRPQITKLRRRNNQPTQESIFEASNEIQDFLPDFALQNDNFMERYPARRTRKDRKRKAAEAEEQKGILEGNASGYHSSALNKRIISQDNPYKNLQF